MVKTATTAAQKNPAAFGRGRSLPDAHAWTFLMGAVFVFAGLTLQGCQPEELRLECPDDQTMPAPEEGTRGNPPSQRPFKDWRAHIKQVVGRQPECENNWRRNSKFDDSSQLSHLHQERDTLDDEDASIQPGISCNSDGEKAWWVVDYAYYAVNPDAKPGERKWSRLAPCCPVEASGCPTRLNETGLLMRYQGMNDLRQEAPHTTAEMRMGKVNLLDQQIWANFENLVVLDNCEICNPEEDLGPDHVIGPTVVPQAPMVSPASSQPTTLVAAVVPTPANQPANVPVVTPSANQQQQQMGYARNQQQMQPAPQQMGYAPNQQQVMPQQMQPATLQVAPGQLLQTNATDPLDAVAKQAAPQSGFSKTSAHKEISAHFPPALTTEAAGVGGFSQQPPPGKLRGNLRRPGNLWGPGRRP